VANDGSEWIWWADLGKKGTPGSPVAIGLTEDGVGVAMRYQSLTDSKYYLVILDAEDGSVLLDTEVPEDEFSRDDDNETLIGDSVLWSTTQSYGIAGSAT
jgi:hypothetical protein